MTELETIFKQDLYSYLRSADLIDERLPEAPDLEELWPKLMQAYMPDALREFNDYPVVVFGWVMYVGMAVAKYWDEDWELYSRVDNLYIYLRDQRDFDHMDDYIREKVLFLNKDQANCVQDFVAECAARTNSLLIHQHIEPGTKEALQAFVAALHQLYFFGSAIQLKRMGYHMTAIG